MEVREIVTEAPVSGFKQAAQNVSGAVASRIPGMKNIGANISGKADLSKLANQFYTQFNRYLGTQGKNVRQATGDDLANFFKSKNVKLGITVPSGVLQKAQIDQVMIDAAKKNPEALERPAAPAKASGNTATGRVPAGFLKKLDTLSAKQRRELASLL